MFVKLSILLLSLIIFTSCQFREGFFYYMGIGNTITFGGSQVDEIDHITTDEEGNIYLAGRFFGVADLNPHEGVDLRSTGGAASSDIYLIKLNPDYTYGWSRMIKGFGMEDCSGLAAANGAVYLMGSFDMTTDFNTDGGGDLHGTIGGKSLFLTAFDSSGEYQFTVTKNPMVGEELYGSKLLMDKAGNLYLFYNIFNGGNPLRIGLIKANNSGSEIWNMETPGGSARAINDAVWGDNGNLYCVGGIMNGTMDYYIAEIEPNGGPTKEWFFGSAGNNEYFEALTADSEGIYLAGSFQQNSLIGGNWLGDGSSDNMVILKASYEQQVQWAYSFERRSGTSLEIDALVKSGNNLYLSGSFNGEVDFKPIGERLISTDPVLRDIYLSSFTTGGSYLDTRVLPGKGDDYNSTLHSGRGWLLWGGSFSGETEFKVKSDGESDIRNSKGLSDVFMTIIVE